MMRPAAGCVKNIGFGALSGKAEQDTQLFSTKRQWTEVGGKSTAVLKEGRSSSNDNMATGPLADARPGEQQRNFSSGGMTRKTEKIPRERLQYFPQRDEVGTPNDLENESQKESIKSSSSNIPVTVAHGLFQTTPTRFDAAKSGPDIKVFLKEIKDDSNEREFSDVEVRQLVELLKKQGITTVEQLKSKTAKMLLEGGVPGRPATIIEEEAQARCGKLPRSFFYAAESRKHTLALRYLTTAVKHSAEIDRTEEDSAYVRPWKFQPSWKTEEWYAELFRGRMSLKGLTPALGHVILGILAGTGNGKSHRLLELRDFAPRKMLKEAQQNTELHLSEEECDLVDIPAVDCFIYVTYSLKQDLSLDKRYPEQMVLLRILLRHLGLSNRSSSDFLQGTHQEYFISCSRLIDMCLTYFTLQGVKHLGISVDELRLLTENDNTDEKSTVRVTTSTLGFLARKLEANGIKCTVLVSSLTDETFSNISSGFPIRQIYPPSLSSSDIEGVIEGSNLQPNSRTAATVSAIRATAGTHFHSLVCAIDRASQLGESTADSIYEAVECDLEPKIHPEDLILIREYVAHYMESGMGIPDSRTRFVTVGKAVPPVFVRRAFSQCHGFAPNTHPAERIFQMSASVNAPKQLEECGMYYDKLRALLELPVLPFCFCVEIINSYVDFSKYKLPHTLGVKKHLTGSIFESCPRSQTIKVVSDWEPSLSQYHLPDHPSHPLIDRASLALGPNEKERALFITRDKVTAKSFPKVVDDLNQAGTLLKEHFDKKGVRNIHIVCVAHFVQACEDTTAQEQFKHPYLLVRPEKLVHYYTPTFAPAIDFCIQRHNSRNAYECVLR